jgi:hypothetical protein
VTTTAPGIAGTVTFGRDYDPATLALIDPSPTIRAGTEIVWRADLTKPADGPTLTFTITAPNDHGPEFPHWQEDFAVPDPSFVILVKRVDLSIYVHGEPGTFIMRIRRGPSGEILAEGKFTVLP